MAKNFSALAHLTHYDDSDAEPDVEESPINDNRNSEGDFINEGNSLEPSGIDDRVEESPEHLEKQKEPFRPISPTTFHLGLQGKSSDEIEIPPPPPGQPPIDLVKKINNLHEKMKQGIDMKGSIESRKDFRNPSIYEKLIVFCDIDELGTNYPKDIYDPHCWGPEAYYDELARKQKEEMDKKEKERKDRTKVEFVTGTAKRTHGENETRKKSKWDVSSSSTSSSSTLTTIPPAPKTLTSKVGALIPGLNNRPSLVGSNLNTSVPVVPSTVGIVKPPVHNIKAFSSFSLFSLLS
ncbi:SAP30-binding protein isoform X3 [Tetranychus urticae]|uniref:SAP30-binding protein isoform X3 n=1 Tax=Tetranychus urticae TaxID=32264 RepID=UPI000D65C2BA|nr:SAP30-binding protein isoform X3 [Tetranychus urticae]